MSQSVYIIAEAGVNHNGSEEKAHALIAMAAESRADAVKFQMFDPASVVTAAAPKADYQTKNLGDAAISQLDMIKKLALPDGAFLRLEETCRKHTIDFLCTPSDIQSLTYLVQHTKMKYLKIGSGDVTNGPTLLAAARSGLPVILSTGMSNLEEVGAALSVLHFGYSGAKGYPEATQPTKTALAELKSRVTLLHCVSQYPAAANSMNLRAMDTMRDAFGLSVGLSDHSLGIDISIATAARGAAVIEKHFTFDKNAAGPDHKASLSADELKAMVSGIREVESALGDGKKSCRPEELGTRDIGRRSVVATATIRKGTAFNEQNLTCKRPATGPLPPAALWRLLGKTARHDYAVDDFIAADELN